MVWPTLGSRTRNCEQRALSVPAHPGSPGQRAAKRVCVTCRLTAKNRDPLRNPALGNRAWTTFTQACSDGMGAFSQQHHAVRAVRAERDVDVAVARTPAGQGPRQSAGQPRRGDGQEGHADQTHPHSQRPHRHALQTHEVGPGSAGLTMWQMWQMPRASGLRGASGSREIFFSPSVVR